MADGIKFKVILPPKFMGESLRQQEKAAQKTADQSVSEYEKVVAKWKPKNKPKFKSYVKSDKNKITWGVNIQEKTPPVFTYWELGTRPHKIKVRRRKTLAWTGADGKKMFAKVVNHPGTKGHFIIKKITRKMKQIYFDNMLLATQLYAKESKHEYRR